MKKCGCEESKTCDAVKSCMYEFIAIEDVPDLGTIIIEDLTCAEKVVVCYEHIPEFIAALQSIQGVNDMKQWLVTYEQSYEIVKCLFNDEQAAVNYADYINDIFSGETKPTIREVIVKYV